VGDSWHPEWGRRVFDREQIDTTPLIAAHEAALAPPTQDWLAARLTQLWKSTTPSGSLDAKSWLHETGRLLMDIPRDILSFAIDEAMRQSVRGFTPSVGEIRAIADPQLKRRKLHCWRLKKIDRLKPEPPLSESERCTPEQAEEIRKAAGIKYEDDRAKPDWIPTRDSMPQWMRDAIAADEAAGIEARRAETAQTGSVHESPVGVSRAAQKASA
jgi:hypothetical protein